jgi:uncharacterized protein (UPF0332 family)
MPSFAPTDRLLRVSKATKSKLEAWREGVSLERDTGRTLSELHHRATADRVNMAIECRRRADRMIKLRPTMYRDAISRHYYAMYHAARALVYYTYGGDDHEAHLKLPQKIPDGMQNSSIWKNTLKNARDLRNRADYEAYPKSDAAWRVEAVDLQTNARDFIDACRAYLIQKGCQYL